MGDVFDFPLIPLPQGDMAWRAGGGDSIELNWGTCFVGYEKKLK
jgi:hypothetical protein